MLFPHTYATSLQNPKEGHSGGTGGHGGKWPSVAQKLWPPYLPCTSSLGPGMDRPVLLLRGSSEATLCCQGLCVTLFQQHVLTSYLFFILLILVVFPTFSMAPGAHDQGSLTSLRSEFGQDEHKITEGGCCAGASTGSPSALHLTETQGCQRGRPGPIHVHGPVGTAPICSQSLPCTPRPHCLRAGAGFY